MAEQPVSEKELRTRVLDAVAEYYLHAFGRKNDFNPGDRVHYAGRVFDERELINLVDASLDFWLTEGRYAENFIAALSSFLGIDSVLLVNSGSSANLVALSALTSPKLKDRMIRPGDEVITAAAGFPTTVNPIVQNRAVPVFVDVELGTYVPTPEIVERAIGPKTKAIMMAHTMGIPFDAAALRELCDRHNLWLIEDCCDALGSRFNGRYVGTFGDLSTLSFYPAHQITMGEGGAVLTGNEELAKIARSFRDWGRDCYCTGGRNNTCGRRFTQQFGTLPYGYDHKYVYTHLGYNLKVTDMQAAIGCAQIEKLEGFITLRRNNWSAIRKRLQPFSDRLVLPETPEKSEPCYFGFVITIRDNAGFSRNDLTEFLEGHGIETRNLFCGNLIRQPAFSGVEYRVAGTLRNTDTIMEQTFFVGCYPGIDQSRIDYMISVFEHYFTGR
ncbi:MAG: lipopolysaccharide biosynthesis protein RfbH [bacterium]